LPDLLTNIGVRHIFFDARCVKYFSPIFCFTEQPANGIPVQRMGRRSAEMNAELNGTELDCIVCDTRTYARRCLSQREGPGGIS